MRRRREFSVTSETRHPAEVLCIEDNAAFVHALRVLVHRRIYAVSTLREGLRALAGHRWSRVILDLDLPDSPKEQTESLIPAVRLAAHDAVLIVLTGFCVDRDKLRELGASEVIEKSDGDFANKLLRWL